MVINTQSPCHVRAFVKHHTNMMLFKVTDVINMILYIVNDHNMLLKLVKDHSIINIYYDPLKRQRDCPIQHKKHPRYSLNIWRAYTQSRTHIYPRARQ